jgi:hypothetical protein
LGGKKVAVAHKIVVIVYDLLAEGTCYEEARYDHLQSRQEAQQQAVKALERVARYKSSRSHYTVADEGRRTRAQVWNTA